MEAINDMHFLKETCRSAFVGAPSAPSATQQQVSETLRHMGLSVKDEDRCPKSGYSIDMVVHDSALGIGRERSSGRGPWAVEFDAPSHFLASGAPTGATLPLQPSALTPPPHRTVATTMHPCCYCCLLSPDVNRAMQSEQPKPGIGIITNSTVT